MINKIRTFPEYHDALGAVTTNRNEEAKIIEQSKLAFGGDFDHFIKSQPEDLQDALSGICQAGNAYVKASEEFHGIVDTLTADFSFYLTSYNEKKAKLAETEAAENNATKAEDKATAAEQKAQKSKPADQAKNEQIAQQLRSTATELRQQATSSRSQFDEYNKEYAAKVTDTFSTMLDAFFQKRSAALRQIITAANDLSNSVLSFHQFTDPIISSLEQRLKEYENVQI